MEQHYCWSWSFNALQHARIVKRKAAFFKTESGLAITADARIDNRDELYLLLGLNSSEEKQLPDSSLILLLYEKYSEDCVKHIIGDFAFAVWNDKTQQLFAPAIK
ncbi:hypothetical protein HK413_01850 [Mucilaginibacter sp. S1162]|uniref:Glutamine amidotransferase type-2 domain-containing protein n=1 Tax=Mucilaginibacter humi TaxID=2732510 RepID=A0ABX1VZ47_9SPHI|nr:hypothetical protein [Mucilaginibacter humi]NNU33227.1 hypothetical protein [Mucilaginibacter humi]